MAMANINIRPRHVTALCARYGYQATIPDPNNVGQTIANPQTDNAFAEQVVRRWVRDETEQYEKRQAAITAESAVAPLETT